MEEQQQLAKSVSNISGTVVNLQNSQLLISSGIPSLDNLLGGGIAVGTLILVEEDQTGSYAKVMTKYFLAEGVVCKHSAFVASQDVSTESIVRDLPAVIEADPEPTPSNPHANAEMKIAFRYQHLPTTEKTKHLKFGHFFDLTKNISPVLLRNSDISHWKLNDKFGINGPGTFSNPAYHDLLQSIHKKIKTGQFSVTDTPKKRSILRIAISALGSPMWLGIGNLTTAHDQGQDLNKFVYCLRALVRNAFAVALITIPSHLIEKGTIDRCIYSSDFAFKLQSFSGTHLEKNPVLADYQGYFQIVKSAAINSFESNHPGNVEYTFKQRRKKFSIEMLHLPPDVAALDGNHVPSMGCSSNTGKSLLDF